MTLKRTSMVKKVGNIYSSLLLPIFEVYPDFSAVFFLIVFLKQVHYVEKELSHHQYLVLSTIVLTFTGWILF